MDFFLGLWIFLIGVTCGLLIGVGLVHKKAVKPLNIKIREIEESKQSPFSVYGRFTEHFPAFMKTYPFNPKKFYFLGEPVDGIQFDSDKLLFVEFQTRGGELNEEQKVIKHLVETKQVGWYQFHVEE